ncbi:MAG TPA: condensation domain-containing protein [Terracidiphilus sp.]
MNGTKHESEARSGSVAKDRRRARPLLLPERTMYRDGRTPFTSVFPVKLAGEIEESRLRHALALVQKKHPLLRCVINCTADRPWFALQDEPAPISLRIVERGGENDWQTEVRKEWVAPFDATLEPLVRLVWLRGEKVHEFILVAHHSICDGIAGINLLRECLTAYDQPDHDLGSYDALGGVEDIVPAGLLQSQRFRYRVRWKIGVLRLALSLKRRSKRKRAGPRISAERMYFHRWNIGEGTMEALTQRCRAENVTVLAAVSMAFMQAFRDVLGPQSLSKTYTMVNARRFLPGLRGDAMFGIAPSVALGMKRLPPLQNMSVDGFWSRARVTKTDLNRRIEHMGADLYCYLVGLEGLHRDYAKFVAYFDEAPAVRHLTLSNMGQIDLPQQFRSFRLEKVYSPLVMVSPTPANTVVVSSFGGQLEFAIVSDEHSLARVEAFAIEQRAMTILRTCIEMAAKHQLSPTDNMPKVRANTI